MNFYERFQKGTYCHPVQAVQSDDVEVNIKPNRASPNTATSVPTLPYFTHKSVLRSSLNILCTVFFDIPSSNDELHSVSRLSVVNQVFYLIFATTVDLMRDLQRLSSSSVTQVL